MTQQFEDFVNAALDKSLASDVTLPTANKIPVYTGIGRQVTAKTAAELDIAIKSDVDTALSSKEPTITAGTSSQYYRGDKTFQPLNTNAVTESTDKRYLSDAQKTIATQAATSTLSGYLSSTDWSTFNGKQAALADVVTADTYGSSTQWPIVTVNAKGIVTGVTLQTVPTPTLTDATFSVQKNGSPSIAASWNLTALTASRVHTYPNKAIDFGTLTSVATTDSNILSGTRCRILGGSNNTVSGTDNLAIGCTGLTLSAQNVVALGVKTALNNILFPKGSIVKGSSLNPDLLFSDSLFGAALGGVACLYTTLITSNGTYDITVDGASATTTNSVRTVAGGGSYGGSTHDVEFIVAIGTTNAYASILPRRHFYAKRRVYVANNYVTGSAPNRVVSSSIITLDSDVTLGEAATGTVSVSVFVDTANHIIVPRVTVTTGANQDHIQVSCRVTSHCNRK